MPKRDARNREAQNYRSGNLLVAAALNLPGVDDDRTIGDKDLDLYRVSISRAECARGTLSIIPAVVCSIGRIRILDLNPL